MSATTRHQPAGRGSGWHLFSPSAQQGLRAAVYMASREQGLPISAQEIAECEAIPRPFLAKLLLTLRNRGLVRTTKGPGGGYQLSAPPEEICVGEVIAAFDGPIDQKGCVLGLTECSDTNPCALHEHWKAMRQQYIESISSLSLAEAATQLMRMS